MSGKYLLGNMLSALYNKSYFYNEPVNVVYSNLCESVLKVMKENGYVYNYVVVEKDAKKSINVWPQIVNGNKNMNSFKLISKPSRHIHLSVKELKKKLCYNPFALLLVSTSKGVMEASNAVRNNIGGEVLCEIF